MRGNDLLTSECLALLDVLLELRQALIDQLLLLSRDRADGVDLFHTIFLEKKVKKRPMLMTKRDTHAKFDIGCEEVNALVSVKVALDERGRDDALLAAQSPQ